jgi:nicotinate-nucleotide adenylyltransferase
VHNGHLDAAEELLSRAGLREVWLMPNARPPHREIPGAPAEDRVRMAELAVENRPGLKASRLEVERGGRSYTIDTMRELGQRYPDQQFDLLLGADAALQIGGWRDAPALLDATSFVIFSRPGTSLGSDELTRLGFSPERTKIVALHTPNIAAHEIRQRLAEHRSIDDLVPAVVSAYIRQHHLYGA